MPSTIVLPSGDTVCVDNEPLLIGRDAVCQVSLPHETALRPQHAKITRIANRWLIESLGDWLIQVGNAPPAHKNWLQPGDVIRLSEHGPTIVFEPLKTKGVVDQPPAPLIEFPPNSAPSTPIHQQTTITRTEMPSQWYYAQGDQTHGPIPSAELKCLATLGQLRPTDLVWGDGMGTWAAASTIKGLFSAVPSPVVATRGPSPLQQTPIASQHPPHAQATVSLTEGTPTIADQWYYAQQGQQKGPLSEEQLRQLATSGQIQPTDLAWKQGMASWMPASQIQGLIFPQSACVTTSMYCRNCGKPVDARAVACVSCGLVPSNGNNYCRICGANTHPAAIVCVKCGISTKGGVSSGSCSKSKVVAGLFAIFLGGLGIHKFYLGFTIPGLVFLLTNTVGLVLTMWMLFLPNILLHLIALVEGVIYLTRSDEEFERLYVAKRKQWF